MSACGPPQAPSNTSLPCPVSVDMPAIGQGPSSRGLWDTQGRTLTSLFDCGVARVHKLTAYHTPVSTRWHVFKTKERENAYSRPSYRQRLPALHPSGSHAFACAAEPSALRLSCSQVAGGRTPPGARALGTPALDAWTTLAFMRRYITAFSATCTSAGPVGA